MSASTNNLAPNANVAHIPGRSGPDEQPTDPRSRIGRLLTGPESDIGDYLESGGDFHRGSAMSETLDTAHALIDVLSAIDPNNHAVVEATAPGSLSRLAWLAQSMIERAIELERHGRGSHE